MKVDYLEHGDCLELMKDIPDGSVDLILCDLPYGTVKGLKLDGWANNETKWDERLDTKTLFAEYERILRINGVAILFSQEPYTSHLRTFKSENFTFCYPMIWKKDHFANSLSCKKAPVSYFEDLNVFVKRYDKQCLHPLRYYSEMIIDYIGISCKDVNKKLGHRKAEHFLYVDSTQYSLCTKETYKELIDKFGIDKMEGFKTFEELKEIDRKFKRKFKRTFNLPDEAKYVSNVLEFKKDYQHLHPTQKPVALLEYLIKVYTNEGDIVLDNCMGSGSTCVAAIKTNRHYIGYEKEQKYFDIAKQRIEDTQKKMQ